MNTFSLRVIASNKVFYEGKCSILVIPAMDGEVAVQAHHEDMVIAVDIGEIRFTTEDGKKHHAVVGAGFLQFINNRGVLLVDTAERPEDIDRVRAEEAKGRAEEQLRQKQSIQEYYQSQASLARALTRLRVSNEYQDRNM